MNLEYIKLALGLDDDSKDVLISRIYTNVERAICLYLDILYTNELPQELEWIVEECTIVRYNRIGSEGIVQESVDSLSTTYTSDMLKDYYVYLNKYKENSSVVGGTTKRLRML